MTAVTYKNLHLWDVVSDSITENAAVTVEAGVITAISNGASDNGDAVKDMGGAFVIPGLIDAHIHLCLDPEIRNPDDQDKFSDAELLQHMRQRVLAMAKVGITTARDLGGGRHLELTVRDEVAAGETPGCRLVCAGQPITSVEGHCHFWGGEASNTEEALAVLERQDEAGVDLIKMMVTGGNMTPGSTPADSQFADETVKAVVSEAAKRHYRVAAHCHGSDGIRQAAEAPVTTVEHCSWVGKKEGWGKAFDETTVATLAANNVWVSPTISSGWQRFTSRPDFLEMVQANYEKMKAAGVRLIASTDAGIPNVRHTDLPRALPVFAKFAGLSSAEVLRSATADCADALGLGEVTGQLREGYAADFICFAANPLDDLEVLASPQLVVAAGREMQP